MSQSTSGAGSSGGARISGLMNVLPKPEKTGAVKRAIDSFFAQTHPEKELVLTLNEGPSDVKATLVAYAEERMRETRSASLRVVELPRYLPLCTARNIALESAAGDVLCQWDDDDICHPERLAVQFEALQREAADAVYLQDNFHLFWAARELYWTTWGKTEAKCLQGTMMCRAGLGMRYPDEGEKDWRVEDHAMCMKLQHEKRVAFVAGQPQLYVYICHGLNYFGAEHHQMLVRELGLSQALLRKREARVRAMLEDLELGIDCLVVAGSNGPAFTVDGACEAATAR